MGMPTVCPVVRREEIRPGDHPPGSSLPQAAGIPAAFAPPKARRGTARVGKRNRGNPNWGHAQIPSLNAQQKPTMFSRMLAEYRLTEENCIKDFRARHWIRKHAKLYYVPEYLLKAIGEEVRPEDVL